MKQLYLKPELEIMELEAQPILAGTNPTDDPSKPLPNVPFDESREISDFD